MIYIYNSIRNILVEYKSPGSVYVCVRVYIVSAHMLALKFLGNIYNFCQAHSYYQQVRTQLSEARGTGVNVTEENSQRYHPLVGK